MNSLKINVSQVINEAGAALDVQRSATLNPFSVGGQEVPFNGPVEIRLSIENASGRLLVKGEAAAVLCLECARCLESFDLDVTLPIDEIFARAPAEDEGLVVDDQIDLGPVIEEAASLAVPIKPLHSPDCKGLCPICGQNLNVADCGHRVAREPGLRKLGELLDKSAKRESSERRKK